MHSAEEMFRGTVRVQSLGGDARVWLTVGGARKSTVSMVDAEVSQLRELLITAQRVSVR
ncbi:MAG: hypothetical protein WCF33_11025 [Pseudonocardiaceae bacterium]